MIRTEKKPLLTAIQTAAQIVNARNTIPILANIKIEAADNVLTVTATDLDVEISSKCTVLVDDEIGFTAPAATLKDIVAKMADEREIEIEPKAGEAGMMLIKSGRSRFSVLTLPVEDFPDMAAAGTFSTSFDLPSFKLSHAIKGVSFAISDEQTRYYLNGIFAHKVGDKMHLVATDGHRLARRSIDWPGDAPAGPFAEGIIIPERTVDAIVKSIDKTATVTIEASDEKIRITAGNHTITSKLIDGTFPDYRRIIDGIKPTVTVQTIRPDLVGAIARVMVVASKSSGAKMEFSDNGGMTINVRNQDIGTAVEEIEIELDGPAFEYGVNGKYLAEAIGEIDGDDVLMRFGDLTAAMILQSAEGEADDLILVVPMRTVG